VQHTGAVCCPGHACVRRPQKKAAPHRHVARSTTLQATRVGLTAFLAILGAVPLPGAGAGAGPDGGLPEGGVCEGGAGADVDPLVTTCVVGALTTVGTATPRLEATDWSAAVLTVGGGGTVALPVTTCVILETTSTLRLGVLVTAGAATTFWAAAETALATKEVSAAWVLMPCTAACSSVFMVASTAVVARRLARASSWPAANRREDVMETVTMDSLTLVALATAVFASAAVMAALN